MLPGWCAQDLFHLTLRGCLALPPVVLCWGTCVSCALLSCQSPSTEFRWVSRVIDDSRRQGVPVYILALAGLDGLRPSFKKIDLDAIARETGGRVFYISRQDELGQAYVRINEELRSQVILAFAAPRDLTQEELLSLEVRIKKPGLEVRSVVAGRAMR